MATPRDHLDKAPIVEAVVDGRVLPREGLVSGEFAAIGARLGRGYSDHGPLQSFETRFGVKDGRPMSPDTTATELGRAFRLGEPPKPTAIAQFRTNGFTFN